MELKDYLRPLRRWWWLVVAATLVATVAGYLATRQQSPVYRTRTTLMVGSAIENPNPNGNEFWLTQQLANTYADIAQRDNVRTAAAAKLNLTVLPEYTARVVPNTQLIELSVTDIDPVRAQQVAQALAEQLIAISPAGPGGENQQRQAFISQQLNDLEVKIQETQDEIDRKQAELGDLFAARPISEAQTQIAALQNKKATLQANYAALLSNTQRGALNSVSIIEPAALNPMPVGPDKRASILLAAAIGLLLAAGAAYLLDYLDDTLKTPDDVQRALGLTTLGATPRLNRADSELAMLSNSEPAATEAYRVLRTNLQFASVDRPIRTLLITSPAPGEGKTLTAANLAVALAQAGRRVILVDADLRKPRLHHVFKLPNHDGLTTALVQERPDFDGLLQAGPEPGLFILTSGPLPPNPSELLGSGRTRATSSRICSRRRRWCCSTARPPQPWPMPWSWARSSTACLWCWTRDAPGAMQPAGRSKRCARSTRGSQAQRSTGCRGGRRVITTITIERAAAVSGASDGDGRFRGRKHKRATQAPTSAAPQG